MRIYIFYYQLTSMHLPAKLPPTDDGLGSEGEESVDLSQKGLKKSHVKQYSERSHYILQTLKQGKKATTRWCNVGNMIT